MARTTTIARTRAKAAADAAAGAEKKKTTTSSSIYTLASESENPPKLFILPKTASPSARIVTLQNPRYNKPTRYLVCPETGFFEFTSISPPKSTPRSWLIQPTNPSSDTTSPNPQSTAQTTESPTLHLATPYDPLFLLLPALCIGSTSNGFFSSSPQQQQKQKRMFLSLDDHLDSTPDPAKHMAELLASCPTTKDLVEARMQAVCDVVQAGDESMYRVNEARLLGEVLGKARAMVGVGGLLPGSMEERFVRKELEAPVLGVRVARGAAGNGDGSVTPSLESQASVESAETAASAGSEMPAPSTPATSAAEEDVASAITASEEVIKLQRLRVAFNFICSSYVAPSVAGELKKRLAQATDLVDFKPLDEYLERLTKLRQEAVAARSTDYSRKRVADEEDDERAEKRRKKEAEEKSKKANMSRGVKNLMKANTSGMKKMSDFFKKKA